MSAPETHDDYLAALPDEQRAALSTLRAQIRRIVPDANEVISYGIPAFRRGGIVAGYAAMKDHCGFYVFDGGVIGRFTDELVNFSISKGTIRFTPDKPIPEPLLSRILAARLAEIG
jgi:uncharacterized protein YdhG (YjbR/CyaY superfamily)